MDKKIKICAITTISKQMDWFIVDSMRNLAQNGYKVTLICNMDEQFIQRNRDFAECIPLSMERGVSIKGLMKSIKQLTKIFKEKQFNMIYYMSPNASFYASIAGKKAKIKYRVYSQCGLRYVAFSGIKRTIFKLIEKWTCKKSTHVRAQSPLNMQFALDEKLCNKEKIAVVGIGGTIGVDLNLCDSFNHQEVKRRIREQYNIPQDAFVYGYVGRLNVDKGTNELIQAFVALNQEKKNSYLMLVGMLDDANPITEENKRIAESSTHIIMTGNVPNQEVYHYMAAFDVLVHPTYREGYGKVLQEAMGMSLPIITTDIPGPSEVIAHGEYGVLVEVKNVADLQEKMLKIADNDKLREELSIKGRQRAETYYNRPIMLENQLNDMNLIALAGEPF